jgi:hypothetical protein
MFSWEYSGKSTQRHSAVAITMLRQRKRASFVAASSACGRTRRGEPYRDGNLMNFQKEAPSFCRAFLSNAKLREAV